MRRKLDWYFEWRNFRERSGGVFIASLAVLCVWYAMIPGVLGAVEGYAHILRLHNPHTWEDQKDGVWQLWGNFPGWASYGPLSLFFLSPLWYLTDLAAAITWHTVNTVIRNRQRRQHSPRQV